MSQPPRNKIFNCTQSGKGVNVLLQNPLFQQTNLLSCVLGEAPESGGKPKGRKLAALKPVHLPFTLVTLSCCQPVFIHHVYWQGDGWVDDGKEEKSAAGPGDVGLHGRCHEAYRALVKYSKRQSKICF